MTKEEVNELRGVNEVLDHEEEEHIRYEPVLMPQNTMYFGGGHHKKKLNFLDASRYRTDISRHSLGQSHMASL